MKGTPLTSPVPPQRRPEAIALAPVSDQNRELRLVETGGLDEPADSEDCVFSVTAFVIGDQRDFARAIS